MEKLKVLPERTPNPNSMKFIVNRPLVDQAMDFKTPAEAARSPLASKLFGFPWTAAVHIAPGFITISKQDWVDWEMLAEPLAGLLFEHLSSGELLILPDAPPQTDSADIDENDSPVVQQIKLLLNNEIRPAVAMDGGDIIFHRYEKNILYIYMRGACSGCPSATITLKQGIEARLKAQIPEILEVIAL